MTNSVIGALRVNLGIDSAQFEKGLKSAQKSLQATGKQLQGIGRSMSTYVTAPIVGFGVITAKVAGDFEKSMNQVAAVSGATGKEFEALRKQAMELGATTQFSSSEAADAMNFLAMAGLKTNEILSAMPDTLKLAAAANLDMASAADIVTNILAGYNKDVSELSHATDVLVKSFTSANTDLRQLGEAMKYAGPPVSAAGVQFEEAAAAIAMMGNAGIQGSMAGTSLRGAISRILKPTKEVRDAMTAAGLSFTDASGKLLPLANIIEQLEPHAENAGLFMGLFGQRAGPAMTALVSQGADALRKLTNELENSTGTAAQIAAVQMEGFNGALRELESAFEGLQLAIADSGFLDWLTDVVRWLTVWTQSLSATDKEMLKWGVAIAGVAAAIGPLVGALGLLVSGIGALTPVISAVIPVVFGIGKALAALAIAGGPITLVVAAVAGLVAVWANWDTIGPMVAAMVKAVTTWLKNKLGSVLTWVGDKIKSVTGFFADMYDKVVGNSYVPDMVDGIAVEFGRLDQVMIRPAEDATGAVNDAFEGMGRAAGDVFDGIVRNGKISFDSLRDVARRTLDNILNDFISAGVSSLFGGIGGKLGGLGKVLGFRADGGPVTAGRPYIVGERGPELIVPRTSGQVIPNHELGGTGVVINQTIAPNFAGNAATRQEVLEIAAMTQQATLAALPNHIKRGGAYAQAVRGR